MICICEFADCIYFVIYDLYLCCVHVYFCDLRLCVCVRGGRGGLRVLIACNSHWRLVAVCV